MRADAVLVATDRHTTAALLAHLGEVDERKLYLPAACASMHAYCTRVLHLAEEVAYKRIRAARIARRFPAIFEAIADGRLHVSGVVLLAPHLTDENLDDVLAAATHRSKAELEELVARLAPRPDLPEVMTRIPGTADASEVLQLDPDPVTPPLDPDPVPARMQARSPDRYGLQVTIEGATRDKVMRAQALLRHRNPGGELADVIDRALDALLETLEKQKFGKTSRPRAAKARGADADPRYVPNEVRRVVSERDGEPCAFVSDGGVRCTERGFLELDHRTMVCRGGQPSADGMRWLCKAHNQYEAERMLGADFMRAKRQQARASGAGAAERAPMEEGTSADRPRAAAPAGTVTRLEPLQPGPAAVEDIVVRGAGPEASVRPDVFDAEVTLALRGLGFGALEVRRAMVATAATPATNLEARIRAALAVLTPVRPFRCAEGPLDPMGLRLVIALGCA